MTPFPWRKLRICLSLTKVLEAAGTTLDKTLKTTCYLNNIDDYGAFNEAYLEYFTERSIRPARVCFATAKLPLGANVEIEATAML